MEDIYQSPAYKKSRGAYYIQCVTEYLVTLLIADAFLAKLLKSMGLPDSLIGIISSLTSFTFLFQLGTIFLMQRIRNVKKTVILIDIASMLCFMCTYFLPFLPISAQMRTILVFAAIGGGYLLKHLQKDLYYKWGHSFVSPNERGAFTSRNEAISMAAGIVFSLVLGSLVDHYEKEGALDRCFLLIGITMAVLTVTDLVMLLIIKPYSTKDAIRQQKPFREVIQNTLGNRSFRNVVIMVSLYDIGRYMTVGFLGTFKTQDLMLSVGTVQLINIGANGLRCVLSRPFGKWADRTSFAHVYRAGLCISACAFTLLAFTSRQTWWLIIGYSVLSSAANAGLGSNANNMTYNYVPIDFFVQAQAIKASITGIVGFAASLIGSRILTAVQANGNMVFGIPMRGQQLLAIFSVCGLLAAIIFNTRVVSKQKIMKQ